MSEKTEVSFDVDANIIDRLKKGSERLALNDGFFSERYAKNIKVIERLFPDVHRELKGYTPTNRNVFLEEDGALNVFFPKTGYTLYSEAPFTQITNRFKEFCRTPGRTMVNLQPGVSDRCRHEYYLTRINAARQKAESFVTQDKTFPDLSGGVVLFGFDLGYQLIKILDEKTIKHIYIYEKDIDLFYYSLFSIDWEWVEEAMVEKDSTIHLFLGIDEKTFIDRYLSALRFNGMYMAAHTYLYMGYGYKHVEDVVSEFKNQFARQVLGWGFFDDGVRGIGQYLGRNKPTYLAVRPETNSQKKFNKLMDVPVFILGNGPSLDGVIDYLRLNKENCIIVSCGTTINTLAKYNIKPDYHVDVERLKYTAEKLGLLPDGFLDDVIGLTVNVMHPEFYDYFEKSVIAMKPGEPISSIMRQSQLISPENRNRLMTLNYPGPIVANTAMAYFSEMGFHEIYLAGVDCGFRDVENHHSKASPYYFDDGTSTNLAKYSNLISRDANFGGVAYTNELMDASRIQLELAIKRAKSLNPIFGCYNLSDGVKVRGAAPLLLEDCLMQSLAKGTKENVKAYIWDNYVAFEPESNERDLTTTLAGYSTLVEDFLALIDREFDDKKDVLLSLAKMNSILMKQYFESTHYNTELMFGSFIYFANEVVDLLFYSEQVDYKALKEMTDLFSAFLREMPDMLANPMDEIDKGNNALEGRYNA